MFIKQRKEYVDQKTINAHLKYCFENRLIVDHPKFPDESFGNKAFVEDKEVQFRLTYKKGSGACTYIFKKDGNLDHQVTDGGEAFRILNKYYKVPRFTNPSILAMSAIPLLYKNEKYEGTRNNAIGYDLNSAYSYAMLQPMPDTSKPFRQGTIKEGEIGFIEIPARHNPEVMSLVPISKGYSLYIFPLMESPFKRFVENWYNKKLVDKTKHKAKGVLNYSVGYLQRVNPFLRATIIGYCNNLIESLIDEDTLYCNTDSIVSLSEKTNLTLGTAIGNWKIEHEGTFAFKGFNYQWNLDVPHYRGVSRKWFTKDWDLLKDSLPTNGNIYEYKDYQIVRRDK